MKYDYSVYYRQNCVVPLILALFSLAFLSYVLIVFWRSGKKESTDYAKVFLFLCIGCFLLGINVVSLSRGGIFLLFEKETDQIQIEGIVEETIEIDSLTGAEYRDDNPFRNHGHGEALVIKGEKYYLTSYGDTKVGDYVRLSILPKSHFVLELNRVLK